MKVLVVGAGAVGQTFGYHLQLGGADVHFFVKEKYAEQARAGFTLYDLRRGGREQPLPFEGFGVLTSAEAVSQHDFDVVLITVSSSALGSGEWVAELVDAAPRATIVGMQPGLGDWDLVRRLAGAERVVWGMIELIAYQAPLQGETVPRPGIAYWIPRWLLFPFSGPDERVQPVVDAFRAGGLRSKQTADVTALTAVGAPAMNLHIAALESVGWSLSALAADRELLSLTGAAVQEASAAAARQLSIEVPRWIRWMRPWQLRLLAWAAPKLTPLDLETYLQFHFTKVGEQTRMSMDRWIDAGDTSGMSTTALRALRDRRAAADARAA